MSGSLWSIECHPDTQQRADGPLLNVKTLKAVFDGTNIYQLYAIEIPPDKYPPNYTGPRDVANGHIVNGPVPQRLDQRLQFIWLGTASGAYFRSLQPGLQRSLMLPPEDPKRHDNSRLVNTWWSYDNPHAYIPTSVVYEYEQTSSTQRQDRTTYTNGVFSTTSLTNVGDWQLPGSFEATSFSHNITNIIAHITCSVTSVSATPDTLPVRPTLAGTAYIVDRRITNRVPYVPVSKLSTQWPSIQTSLAIYDRSHPPRKESKVYNKVILVCVFAAALLPLALLYRRSRAVQQKENQQKIN